ncbi:MULTISPECIES: DUF1015 family protein [Streptomyces]|uniref:DUF1015 family protein n=1 Tax=Streptomyces plicatus TaxID=1922 RepID=A0ABW1Y6X0_STRPL|nr:MULTISPECIES: DUF1015 domain-containing protein [Streptomyces]RIH60492.1 DUF1015 domain-containing protein [Streptomyces sp. SHP22-7]MBJ6622268.1 DUF1015 domain-containing protein [Streptomyces sp. DHE17-7]RSS66317.1 DUF1015 domain-containing protein [Streptomyces sp. WAC06273]GGZ73321.1 hypothetical protein GCM10010301_53710 [Streptomyces plicatus]GHC27652.1 hypothetical protein GCM10010308_50840 [Streptomyces vinaceusdrappus]
MPVPAVSLPEQTSLQLRPFRAVRYDADRVGDPSDLLAPPYGELDAAGTRTLRRHPHHVARLLYADAPHAAARELGRWLRRGVLRRDEQPALYVYQQHHGARILQRGLVGDLMIPREPGQLLPHEEVSTHMVLQRSAHMSMLRAQFEPLLLAHRGTEEATAQVMDRVTRRSPVTVARIGKITHSLWACDDARELELVTSGLSVGRALIADGHHRHAACLQLSGDAAGPWGSSLALLVDTEMYPLRLSAIHRVLPTLEPEKAARAAAEVARVLPLSGGPRTPEPGELILAGGGQAWTITDPDPLAVQEALADHPGPWAQLPSAVSDHLLLRHTWSVPDLPGAVTYAHDIRQAIAAASVPGGGSALLLPAISEQAVWDLAGAGVLLPRKSTSFGPKPAAGLAMRVMGLS